jgi:hypothetical protein
VFENDFIENAKSELKSSIKSTRSESQSASSNLLKKSAAEKDDNSISEKQGDHSEEVKQEQVENPEIDLRGEGKIISQIEVLDLP